MNAANRLLYYKMLQEMDEVFAFSSEACITPTDMLKNTSFCLNFRSNAQFLKQNQFQIRQVSYATIFNYPLILYISSYNSQSFPIPCRSVNWKPVYGALALLQNSNSPPFRNYFLGTAQEHISVNSNMRTTEVKKQRFLKNIKRFLKLSNYVLQNI